MDIKPLHTTVEKTIQIKNGTVIMESHSGFPFSDSNLYLIGPNGLIIWKAEKPEPKTLFSKVKLNDDMTLSTFTISGQLCEINMDTGKIISSTSFK
ncbi:MAG: hypothetical protein JNM55_05995 [Anaerolineales bacterium]|nr:hypothetical protein [Anaerolineales bacterium]